MNDNQLTIVKEYEFDNPHIQKIDFLIDNSIRGCHYNYFHTFDHVCENDLNFTNTTNKETVKFTTSDKNMIFYDLNKKITVSRKLVIYLIK